MSCKAVLVIDMLGDFINESGSLYVGPHVNKIIKPIKDLVENERAKGSSIIYICDNHLPDDAEFKMFTPHCIKGTEGAAIIDVLKPEETDHIINKRRYSAFAGTDLDITLREKSVTDLVLVGVCTNICVLYTSADARNLNYIVTVPEQCVTSFDLDAHDFALRK